MKPDVFYINSLYYLKYDTTEYVFRLLDVIGDTCYTSGYYIRIKNEENNWEMVRELERSKFGMVTTDSSHIEYIKEFRTATCEEIDIFERICKADGQKLKRNSIYNIFN